VSGSGTEPGTLYLCATPIGNLGDITLRALEALRDCDLVAAEDTRRTRRLLSHYDIHKPMMSYREENRRQAGARIITRLQEGQRVALVSDAGTPGISDPGHDLVVRCLEAGLPVEVMPGANAALTALVLSGLPTRRFSFEGFLPRKKGARRRVLEELASDRRTLVFHESPQRIAETLTDVEEVMGDRTIVVARELTKKYEEVIRGKAGEVRRRLAGEPVKGELVLVVEGASNDAGPDLEEALSEVLLLREQGLSLKDAAGRVAESSPGISRSRLYNAALKR
jgi:16S rRNA (cytidine1402-2'-O)-methyltransferase